MLIGVASDGTAPGQQIGERTLERLSEEIQRITPAAFPSVEQVRVAEDRHVIAIFVDSGTSQLYMYKRTAYRRVGRTTLALSQ